MLRHKNCKQYLLSSDFAQRLETRKKHAKKALTKKTKGLELFESYQHQICLETNHKR